MKYVIIAIIRALKIGSRGAHKHFSTLHKARCTAKAKLALKRSNNCLCGRFASPAGCPEKSLKSRLMKPIFHSSWLCKGLIINSPTTGPAVIIRSDFLHFLSRRRQNSSQRQRIPVSLTSSPGLAMQLEHGCTPRHQRTDADVFAMKSAMTWANASPLSS